jgi:hypothetical protein
MRCTNWLITSLAGVLVAGSVILGTGTASGANVGDVRVIDDADVGEMRVGYFDYIGSWQHVRGKRDGRSNGTSTRSTHAADVALLRFTGTRIRLFGIRGPSGGRASIALDGASVGSQPVDFYAPHLETHALIFASRVLTEGLHTLAIVVWGTRDPRGHFYYVNIDGAEVAP